MSTEDKDAATDDVGFAQSQQSNTSKLVPLDKIATGDNEVIGGATFNTNNVRVLEDNYNWDDAKGQDKQLLESVITMGGFHTPVILEKVDGDSYVPLQGNRRISLANWLLEQSEDGAEEYIGVAKRLKLTRGIPAIVYENLTDEQRWSIVCDQAFFKKLSKIEQFYAVGKFNAFGWTSGKISKYIGISQGQVAGFVRIHKLSDSDHPFASELYDQAVAALRAGKDMPPVTVLSAVANIVGKAKVDEETGETVYETCGTGEMKGKSIEEIEALHASGEAAPKRQTMRTRKEIEDAYSKAADGPYREALKWVLAI